MASITIKTTVTTTYDVPDGVPLERIQHLALCEITEDEDAVAELLVLHGKSLSAIFYGDEQFEGQSVEHSVTES